MSTPTAAGGFVLAGGKSRRMGRDKSLLDWHGRTLLEHMIALLRNVSDDVRIVGRQELPDNPAGLGPIGGVLTVLRSSLNENNILVAVDLSLLTKEFLKYFKERFENAISPHRLQDRLAPSTLSGRLPIVADGLGQLHFIRGAQPSSLD